MLFNSFEFILFFPIVTIFYFLPPHKWRWLHLLISSCIFYAAFIPIYILILLITIIIDYIAGILIENSQGDKRKLFLIMSIVANVGVLAMFKYYNFFIDNINHLLYSFDATNHRIAFLNIILPIGLSFHTFQAMSYTIEVYRGNHPAERHFGIYALYVMFYPQLVAGPIERPQNVLYQFHEKKYFSYTNASNGLKLMLWGIFKKVVIADRLAQFTDPVFNNPHHYSPLVLLIAAIFFSFQIFCDFSGYSDIALGSAKVMGFKLMKNFDRPYHSKDVSEFWKRWHISLSTWFRDYLYISLGGSRVSVPRWYFNLFFVFLVSGFWHGANWTFIIWGALHGFYLIFAIVTKSIRNKLNRKVGLTLIPRLYNLIQILSTFFLVTIAWIFFRANSVNDAVYIISRIPLAFKDIMFKILAGQRGIGFIPINKTNIMLSILLIAFLEIVHFLQSKQSLLEVINKLPNYLRWGIYYAFVFAIVYLGVYENRQFIYFQF